MIVINCLNGDALNHVASDVVNHCDSDGNCSRCGGCCTDFLRLTEKEIEEIKKFVKSYCLKDCYRDDVSQGRVVFMCPFCLEPPGIHPMLKHTCLIQPVKPEICRLFKCDMSREELAKNKYWNSIDKSKRLISMREEFFGTSDEYKDKVKEVIAGGYYGREN